MRDRRDRGRRGRSLAPRTVGFRPQKAPFQCDDVSRSMPGPLPTFGAPTGPAHVPVLPEGLDDRSAVQRGDLALAPVHKGGQILPGLNREPPVLDHASR
jgi:hypothetical protein